METFVVRLTKRKGRENLRFNLLQRFWEKLNEFNESIREERRSFIFGKNCSILFAQDYCKWSMFCKSGWNGFQIDVCAIESVEFVIHSNNGAMCEFDQNEDIISV